MKINIALVIVAFTALSLLGYRWHRWSLRQDEWVWLGDGYHSGIEPQLEPLGVLALPGGEVVVLSGDFAGYYGRRRNLPARYADAPGISPKRMQEIREAAAYFRIW